MRIRPSVVVALGIGYVLGARAGRDHYDALMRQTREFRERPEVQSLAGVVSAQAASATGRIRTVLGVSSDSDGSPVPGPSDLHSPAHRANGVGLNSR